MHTRKLKVQSGKWKVSVEGRYLPDLLSHFPLATFHLQRSSQAPSGLFFWLATPPMNPDLERLIRLQQLETAADDARRKIADHPERAQALDARLQSARDALAAVKAGSLRRRRSGAAEEKEVATRSGAAREVQGSAARSEDQPRIQAMLHEIETAQNDIRAREDRILEIMMESDELTADVKKSEAELKTVPRRRSPPSGPRSRRRSATLQAELDKTAVGARGAGGADRPRRARDFRDDGQRPQGRRRGGSARRPLHHLPRPAPPPGLQRGPEERIDHPVRQLPPDPVFRRRQRTGAAAHPVSTRQEYAIDRRLHRRRRAGQSRAGRLRRAHRGRARCAHRRVPRVSRQRRRTTSPNTTGCSPRCATRSEHGHRKVRIKSDSELLVKQMRGEYRVKNPGLQPLYQEARTLAGSLDRIVVRARAARTEQGCRQAGEPRDGSRGAADLGST